MGEEARFVARYASVYVRGSSFQEVGDVLAERGFDMVRAAQTDHGVLVIPHREENRQSAHLFAMLDSVEVAEKVDDCDHPPMSLDASALADVVCVCADFRKQHASGVWPSPTWFCRTHGQVDVSDMGQSLQVARAALAGAKVEAGLVEPIPLTCGTCGSVHPEGVICLVPVFYERICTDPNCGAMTTYGHDGPHEAVTDDGLITHRWVEELVVTDLPFNGYIAAACVEDGS